MRLSGLLAHATKTLGRSALAAVCAAALAACTAESAEESSSSDSAVSTCRAGKFKDDECEKPAAKKAPAVATFGTIKPGMQATVTVPVRRFADGESARLLVHASILDQELAYSCAFGKETFSFTSHSELRFKATREAAIKVTVRNDGTDAIVWEAQSADAKNCSEALATSAPTEEPSGGDYCFGID
jgi:hypothetical protein